MEAAEASKAAGEILTAYAKIGPTSPDHGDQVRAQVMDLACSVMEQPGPVTARYARTCAAFLTSVKKVKGMPTRTISTEQLDELDLVSSSGQAIADRFDELLPVIERAHDRCVENHASQAAQYFADQLATFGDLVGDFLAPVPAGGTKDAEIRKKTIETKREAKALAKWPGLFGAYKAMSFSTEVDHIVKVAGDVIAVEWRYSSLDEQGEYRKTYDHKPLDGRVYAIRGSWAHEQGLIAAGDQRFFDEIGLPKQEVGCSCSLNYIFNLRSMPPEMLTASGRAGMADARARAEEFRRIGTLPTPPAPPRPNEDPARLAAPKLRGGLMGLINRLRGRP